MNNKYIYLKKLEKIHSDLFKDNKIRDEIKIESLEKMNNLIKDLYEEEFDNQEVLIKNLLRCMAIIFLYQPFYDGNHRTLLEFMRIFLQENKYILESDNIWRDYLNGEPYIPILYEENDTISLKEINNVLKYTKKAL